MCTAHFGTKLQGMAPTPKSALQSWEYPKGSGIFIREILNSHGRDTFNGAYQVVVPAKLTGRLRERKQFKTRAAAEKHADDTYLGHKKQGEDFFKPTNQDRRELIAHLPALRTKKIAVAEALSFSLKHLLPAGRDKKLSQVVDELVASKLVRHSAGHLRERSYKDFSLRAQKISEGFAGRLASDITSADVVTWVTSLNLGIRSNRNYLAALSEILKFARQKRYISTSPMDELTEEERKRISGEHLPGKEPAILTPDEAERLLKAALKHPELELLGAVTLALFSGIRTEELTRLDWEQVKLAETPAIVTVGAAIAKKRRVRNVDIPENALCWLGRVENRTGPVDHNFHANDHQKRFKKLLKFAGFESWEANAMRHSFGSYHFALHGNSLETSRQLGHKASDQVLFDHYRALATKAQAEKYFAIIPSA